MFSPQKLLAIMTLTLMTCTLFVDDVSAQGQSQYEARLQAMQQARARAQQTTQRLTDENVKATAYQQGIDYEAPPAPPADPVTRRSRRVASRVARRQAPVQRSSTQPSRTNGRPGNAPKQYTPRHLRTAQIYDGQIIDGGAPIVSDAPFVSGPPMVSGPPVGGGGSCGGGCGSCGTGGCSSGSCGDAVYSGVVSDCGSCGGCGSCGPCGLEFSCAERGGCPPGTWQNCWIGQIGVILKNADYFAGASAFKGPSFNIPGTVNQQTQTHDCNFGFYGGVNLGIPLCKLSCGLLSGQIGVRTVQSDFNGSTFTPDNRDQTFVTVGIYRRVDYGLQAGVAYDWLQDKWFTESEVSQIRIDVGWVYPGGTTLGFRSATNQDSDVTNGIINGIPFAGLVTTTLDNYRFYLRRDGDWGGYTELFAGWTDDDRTVLGTNCDIPVRNNVAVHSGLTYVFADETAGVGGTDSDSWNLFMGFSFRPRGLSWYKNYDRPMFDVADNGSMLLLR